MGNPKPLICAYFTEHWYVNTHPPCMLWVHRLRKARMPFIRNYFISGRFILNNTIKRRHWCRVILPTLSKFTANPVRVSDVLSRRECFNQPDFFFCSLCSLRTGNFMALLCCTMCTVITYATSMPLMNEHWVCVSNRWECSFDLLDSTTVADGCLNCFINVLKSSIISQTILKE